MKLLMVVCLLPALTMAMPPGEGKERFSKFLSKNVKFFVAPAGVTDDAGCTVESKNADIREGVPGFNNDAIDDVEVNGSFDVCIHRRFWLCPSEEDEDDVEVFDVNPKSADDDINEVDSEEFGVPRSPGNMMSFLRKTFTSMLGRAGIEDHFNCNTWKFTKGEVKKIWKPVITMKPMKDMEF